MVWSSGSRYWEVGGSNDGSGIGLFHRDFTTAGEALGIEKQVNAGTAGDQWESVNLPVGCVFERLARSRGDVSEDDALSATGTIGRKATAYASMSAIPPSASPAAPIVSALGIQRKTRATHRRARVWNSDGQDGDGTTAVARSDCCHKTCRSCGSFAPPLLWHFMVEATARTGDWLRRHVEEIAEDPALRAYGAVLAALHVLVAYWLYSSKLFLIEPTTEAVCWPLVPGCEALRVLTPGMLRVVVLGYGALALTTAILFLRRRTAGVAVVLLAGLVAIEVSILALDFRLRRNQHYMSLATTLTFLLVPRRRDTVRVLIVLFYVWAGMLKLDLEWLSGSGLYKDPWLFTGRGIVVACVYVVVLELFVVWGMLARSAAWFWSAFAQVIVFHIFSWPIVGYFYPILMMALLTIFVLCRAVPVRAGAASGPSLLSSFLRGRVGASVYVTAAVLSALQILPYLYPGDVALTGEGRLYALNMFDAKVVCEAYADVRLRDGTVPRESLTIFGEPRTRCDPILVRAAALSLCRSRSEGRRDFVDIDVRLLSRRESGTTLHTLVALDDFCARPPPYDPFFHNEWISTAEH